MVDKQKEAIGRYFADYVAWQILLAVVAVCVTLLAVLIRGWDFLIWLIPAGFAVLWLTGLPVLIYYLRVKREWKTGAVETAVICVADLQVDDTHTFKSWGTVRMGRIKYALTDTEGKRYLLCADEKSIGIMHIYPETVQLQLEVTYLEKSALVLRMQIMKCESKRKRDSSVKWILQAFRQNFRHYLE